MAAQLLLIPLPDIDAVDENLPAVDIVEATEGGDDRSLAAAGGAHQSDFFTRPHTERNIFQHRIARLVGEPDVFELTAPANFSARLGSPGFLTVSDWSSKRKIRSDEAMAACMILYFSARSRIVGTYAECTGETPPARRLQRPGPKPESAVPESSKPTEIALNTSMTGKNTALLRMLCNKTSR